MANLTETAQWESGVRRIETTDQVLGGESGPMNAGIKHLCNRTLFLRQGQDILRSGLHGRSWVGRVPALQQAYRAIAYSPSLKRFVALHTGGSGNTAAMTSDDGVTWTARSLDNAGWQSVCWSPTLNLFAAVADSGTSGGNQVATSPDGITWTLQSAAEANGWNSVCWADTLGMFVAVAGSGTNRVMTSVNGSTWLPQAAAEANSWQSVAWSSELGLLVAGAISGTNKFMTSINGTAWIARPHPATFFGAKGLCYSPELNLFVGVTSSSADRVATSPDGINWTARTAAQANGWQSVAWSPELNLFCACSADGTDRLMTSPDGITWSPARAPVEGDFRRIAWAPELGMFAACSFSGSSFRIISSGSATEIATPSILGTMSNDSAPAGRLGERISSAVTAVGSFSTGTPKDLTSIVLTAGDWDVDAIVTFAAAAITGTAAMASINTTSATHGTVGDNKAETPTVPTAAAGSTLVITKHQISVSATTTVYLVGSITFSAGTPTANGRITARRVR
jgi:hypothetical protein